MTLVDDVTFRASCILMSVVSKDISIKLKSPKNRMILCSDKTSLIFFGVDAHKWFRVVRIDQPETT